ncbi:Winged helix-turn-helix DNA-binding domain,B-block binding subunit of TFIIIC [Cinara cedri]|uniref:Winged helix-turn-helix DNA-binding domain,B-block binding subunit of TFIIIC n=1 Tax=Cinara cedri TaxID=506608 RepID=A0A5E4N3X4_9HEMI|nr:Winged helix-turn-helix DNA-binding domain,B-block binding subunit of TFIIIC [Cinara cedri]
MQRFQKDFSSIILDEIALEGLDGITIEALSKRLSNNSDWPLKPVDNSIKKLVWSFIVCLKNIEFYRLENPRDPLIIFNRFDYVHSEFGSLYEPEIVPKDIYPNHPVEDGSIMGSCKEYFTRFNLGSFPRKISVEEAEKRWGRHLVIVANQDVRTKVLIPDDKQCALNISVRYYLVLERIGRARYLGEASFGTHSLRLIFPDSKALSYVRNRLSDVGLIKNQALAYSGSSTQIANRIVISSLVRFFVQRQTMIDEMVSSIVDYLKLQPNLLASYDQVKAACNISFSKTFKQPQLKKYCDTNLMLKYRELYPNATKSEYSYKKDSKNEKVIRCIKLKYSDNKENSNRAQDNKIIFEGREFKQDCSFDRQILRWIEKHGDLGVTLSEMSRDFRFTTDGSLEGVLKKLISLKYITKKYCDRGRAKVFCYIANNYKSEYKDYDVEMENLIQTNTEELKTEENNLTDINGSLTNMIIETEAEEEIKLEEKDCSFNESNQNERTRDNLEPNNEDSTETVLINIPDENKQCDMEQKITRVMEFEYCKSVYEHSNQTVSMTDRFYFRKQIIFSMLSTENIVSLLNIKKNIIDTEKENPKFIGTIDIKTLVKIIGHFEKMGKLKSVQYRVTYETKTVNHSFVGNTNVDFTSPETIVYMNSFLNRFNNTMKTTRAYKKWNLAVYKSPEPKINILELKLPRFMKMRSLHEYLYYIVYNHPGESLINACKMTEDTVSNYRNDLIQGDKAQLPKVYYPTIGWKMFVPPLSKYPKYPDGWFFVSDIIHHMPLDIMLKIVNFNKSNVNLDKLVNYATHPVFKYLPLMSLSSEVRTMLSQGLKKHIQSTLNVLRLLCMIGLIQFGAKTYKDTELVYAYLNRRASLLNTVKSIPNYYRVSDMDYEKRTYEFFSDYELETYWMDTWYFCTNTPLGYRLLKSVNKPKRQEIITKSKIAIEESCASRGALEAVAQDDGTIPGDNKGAAGFDSHLFAHLSRNWNLKKKITTTTKKKTKSLYLQRIRKNLNRKKNENTKSEITNNQFHKMRFKWTTVEDQVLLFWKLGTMIIKQVSSHAYLSYSIKDIFRSIFGKFYRLKSIDNYLRRIRYLMRNSAIENRVNFLYDELKTDEKIQDTFKTDIEKQHELHKAKKYKAMRDLIVLNIKTFITLLRERGSTIDTRCVRDGKKNIPFIQPLDVKQEIDSTSSIFAVDNQDLEYNYYDQHGFQHDLVQEINYMFTAKEVVMSVISSLIHSSLSNKSNDPKISLTYLQVFKQYPDDVLKQSFNSIKDNNIITCSQYHKESLQILLSTPHIIQSKTYDYGPKFYSTLVGTTDTGRYIDTFIAYTDIKKNLFEKKILLLYPSCGLCSTLTCLSLTNIVDISIEFDKKYLECMPNENLDEESHCLKNTLKRMRSRHFDLLSTSNDSVEYIKIITSVTKQLKNYKVICKLKQSIVNFEEEIDLVLEHIFKKPTFEPQLKNINKLNDLCKLILKFCKTKEQFGASQLDIKKHFDNLPLHVLEKSLNDLIKSDLLLRAGIEVPSYIHYQYTDLWLIKIPSVNCPNVNHDVGFKNENNILYNKLTYKEIDTTEPPLKKLCKEYPKEDMNNVETYDRVNIRPWIRLDLTISQEILEKYLNSVLSKIIVKPGILLKTLKKEYSPFVQPMYIREVVEMLKTMKCINMIHIQNVCRPTFFSSSNHNIIFSDMKGLEDESLIMLEPTLDCEIRFGYFSSKFSTNVK